MGQAGKTGSILLPNRETQVALQKVIERLFESCLREGRYRQVVGIAVEARNLEVLRRVIQRASDDEKRSRGKQAENTAGPAEELMEYVLNICMGVVQERGLRTQILRLILDLLSDIRTPDYFSIAKCAVYLNQDQEASTMLKKLVVSAKCPDGSDDILHKNPWLTLQTGERRPKLNSYCISNSLRFVRQRHARVPC